MGARMVPANGQTTKTKKIFYMSFWLQIYTFVCNFCSRKGGRASIGYRASIGTYTVGSIGTCPHGSITHPHRIQNRGPSDHESHTLCVSPPNEDVMVL